MRLMPSAKRRLWLWVPAQGRDDRDSSIAATFAEQIELLLHGSVRETEQHRIFVSLVGDPLPARHHEQVARTPFEGLIADPRTSLALDRREHGRIGCAI